MKGIVMAAGFMALSMGISVGMMFYISHEQLRLNTETSLKQALSETMVQLDGLDMAQRESQALARFVDNFKVRRQNSVVYNIDLMGFMNDPLALRIRIRATEISALFKLELTAEETMIEVGNENE